MGSNSLICMCCSFCEGQTLPLNPKPLQGSTCQVCWAAEWGGNSVYAQPHSEGCAAFPIISLKKNQTQRTFCCLPAIAERNKWHQDGTGWSPEVDIPTAVTFNLNFSKCCWVLWQQGWQVGHPEPEQAERNRMFWVWLKDPDVLEKNPPDWQPFKWYFNTFAFTLDPNHEMQMWANRVWFSFFF